MSARVNQGLIRPCLEDRRDRLSHLAASRARAKQDPMTTGPSKTDRVDRVHCSSSFLMRAHTHTEGNYATGPSRPLGGSR
jgi:hypothetical protein